MDVNKQLCEAVRAGNLPEVERLLVLPGIDVNNACDGASILFTAIGKLNEYRSLYNPLVFYRLLQVPGIDVNTLTLDERLTPLTMLAWTRAHFTEPPEKANIVQSMAVALINHPNIDLNKETGYGRQGNKALSNSAYSGYTEIARSLLQRPEIDIGAKSSALRTAVENEREQIVALLLAVPDIYVDPHCLITAAISSYRKNTIIKMLLARPGMDVNVASDAHNGRRLLMFVDDIESLELLLQYPGIDVNTVDNDGNSVILDSINTIVEYPRHYNIYETHINKLRSLIKHPGIDLNIQNSTGNTALIIAAKYNKIEIVKLLLESPGIRLDIRNNEGKSAEDIAIEEENLDIARMIQSAVTKLRGRNLATFVKGTKVTKKSSNGLGLSNGTKKSLGLPNMPSDVMNRLGSFFSGKTGSLNQQRFKLRSNLEYRNEPSVRAAGGAGAAAGAQGGGRRRTRRGGSKHRKANRSRRNRR